jgi:hypothetical protein
MKLTIKSRILYYVLFGILYWVIGKVFGFETSCYIMGGTIIGEQAFLSDKFKNED